MYTAGACLVAAAVAARAPGAELDAAPSANEPTEPAGGQARCTRPLGRLHRVPIAYGGGYGPLREAVSGEGCGATLGSCRIRRTMFDDAVDGLILGAVEGDARGACEGETAVSAQATATHLDFAS
jgi:hypothetical protein